MFLLMNEAVLLFSSKWSLLPKKYHRSQYMNIHVILEVMSLICFLLGFYSIYLNKDNLGKPHFTSWHGILGLIQLIAICAQVVIGTFAKYRILPIMFFPAAKLKTVHVTLGITITMLVMCNLITGWYSNWFINNSSVFMFSILAPMCISINGFISYRAMSTNSRVKNVLKLSWAKEIHKQCSKKIEPEYIYVTYWFKCCLFRIDHEFFRILNLFQSSLILSLIPPPRDKKL